MQVIMISLLSQSPARAAPDKIRYNCEVKLTKKILFLIPYPIGEAPSQRFRFEQYFEVLQSNQIDFKVQAFLTHSNWRLFYIKGNGLRKLLALVSGFCRRVVGIAAASQVDYVFIHREASPIGPPIFEWIVSKVLRRRIIYDFDDAIWLTDRAQESVGNRIVKWRGKISTICKMSFVVSCGNRYLCDYAEQFARRVVLNPTTIDTNNHRLAEASSRVANDARELTIGWTGSHSTLKYLHNLEPILQQIEDRYSHVKFLVIADKAPTLNLKRVEFIPWNQSTEIIDLMRIDIGIMPLPNDEWAKGKCGFKILQYMSLCIPSVSSPVGVNTQIVEHGVNGFLASTDHEWVDYLGRFVENSSLREIVGKKGRETVVDRYSVASNASTFLTLFE